MSYMTSTFEEMLRELVCSKLLNFQNARKRLNYTALSLIFEPSVRLVDDKHGNRKIEKYMSAKELLHGKMKQEETIKFFKAMAL